ncbi:hypothetical protein V8E53_005846 [Lactarius tabidus]|jgi:hypothetical protein
MAALEHPDRICGLHLGVTASQLAKLATITQVPFPVLTKLQIFSEDDSVLPSGFLGGYAPHLKDFHLSYIASPELPTLLLSACGLHTLQLHGLSQTGRISPEAMAPCLAGLPKLGTLCIGFLDGDPRLDQIRLSPITRAAVPSLTFLKFIGYSNYFEDLAALIDCPRLNCVKIWYHHSHHVNFQVSQVFQFINRSEDPRLLSRWACVAAKNRSDFTLSLCHEDDSDQTVAISLDSKGWEISHLIQLLSQFSAQLSDVRHLSIRWRLIETWTSLNGFNSSVHLRLCRRCMDSGIGCGKWLLRSRSPPSGRWLLNCFPRFSSFALNPQYGCLFDPRRNRTMYLFPISMPLAVSLAIQ